MYKAITITLLNLLITACTTGPVVVAGDGDAPIRAGMQLELARPVTVPAGNASVYIQNGRVVEPGLQDNYYAWCRLILKTLRPVPHVLPPATFRVIDIQREIEDVRARPLRYAALGPQLAGSATADDYITTFYLQSDQAPDVERLVCAHWEDPTLSPEHLTASQIRKTLGDLLIFR